jgi:hypothetical protein
VSRHSQAREAQKDGDGDGDADGDRQRQKLRASGSTVVRSLLPPPVCIDDLSLCPILRLPHSLTWTGNNPFLLPSAPASPVPARILPIDMDADLWSARMSATKRHQAIQSLSQRWGKWKVFDGLPISQEECMSDLEAWLRKRTKLLYTIVVEWPLKGGSVCHRPGFTNIKCAFLSTVGEKKSII